MRRKSSKSFSLRHQNLEGKVRSAVDVEERMGSVYEVKGKVKSAEEGAGVGKSIAEEE